LYRGLCFERGDWRRFLSQEW